VNVPVHLSSTYAQPEPSKPTSEFDYTRCGNPTRKALEDCITALEYGKHTICYNAGISAFCTVIHTLNHGAHIVAGDDCYGGTNRYLRMYWKEKFHGEYDMVDATDAKNIVDAVKDNTELVIVESPTNPTLKISDIVGIVEGVKKKNPKCLIMCDNTFATPVL